MFKLTFQQDYKGILLNMYKENDLNMVFLYFVWLQLNSMELKLT